jgi:hypothetical protein
MAKSQSIVHNIGRSLLTGFGRQAGFRLEKVIEKEAAKKIIDPNSKFRKLIQRFQLPGTPKAAIAKLWTLVDEFEEEYLNNSSLLQHKYMEDDMIFIDKKFQRVSSMKMKEDEEDNFDHLLRIWERIKNPNASNSPFQSLNDK